MWPTSVILIFSCTSLKKDTGVTNFYSEFYLTLHSQEMIISACNEYITMKEIFAGFFSLVHLLCVLYLPHIQVQPDTLQVSIGTCGWKPLYWSTLPWERLLPPSPLLLVSAFSDPSDVSLFLSFFHFPHFSDLSSLAFLLLAMSFSLEVLMQDSEVKGQKQSVVADGKGHKNKWYAILAQTKSSSGKKKERK